ncbi:DUF2325 domain-containing protein [Bacillus mexicanus]|uniref:DUF2325 domain-containing protein n=1 Tax=Bacillus mexicanus TaxID=2834415 RepID=UPI003D1A99A1
MLNKETKTKLKSEMTQIIQKMTDDDLQASRNNINKYFDFLDQLYDFKIFRQNLIQQKIITEGNETDAVNELEAINTRVNEQSTANEANNNIDHELSNDNESDGADEVNERKMYKFIRNIKAGALPEIKAYVPESVIRDLGLENNCYVYAEPIGEEGKYHYELAKKSEDPNCPNRIQLDYCLVEKEAGMLTVSNSYTSGAIRYNEAPHTIIIKEYDINEFKLEEGDVIDIAYPAGRPDDARVIWLHKNMGEEMNGEEKNTNSTKISKTKRKNSTSSDEKEEVEQTLADKSILIVGNETQKTKYKQMIEERGGSFLWADGGEKPERIETLVKKSDVVIFLYSVSGHTTMDKTKAYCKHYDKPFKAIWELGRNVILNEILNILDQKIITNAI